MTKKYQPKNLSHLSVTIYGVRRLRRSDGFAASGDVLCRREPPMNSNSHQSLSCRRTQDEGILCDPDDVVPAVVVDASIT
jgi:hypothetical protein